MNNSFTSPDGFISVTYPDRSPRPRSVTTISTTKPVYTAQSFDDFFLSWLPIYPTRLVPRPPINPNRVVVSTAAVVYPTGFVTSWMPMYPTYRYIERLHRAYYRFNADPLSGADMRVAQQMAWYPRFRPIFLRPKVGRTQFAYVPPAAVIVTGIGCAEMIDEQGAVPTLLTQTFSDSTLIDQAESSPTLINEDFC